MTTRISATAKDKLAQLQVTNQTSFVVTNVKSELELFNIESIIQRIRNNPTEILDIIERLKQNRIKSTLGMLANLQAMLTGDIDNLKFEALRSLVDRLNRVVKDKALLAGLTEEQANQLLMLMQLAQDKLRENKINYSYNGNVYNYGYNSELQDTATRFVDTLTALEPNASVENIDTIGMEAIYTTLIADAVTLGANSVALDYIATLEDPITKQTIIIDSFYNAIEQGNIDYLISLLDKEGDADVPVSIPALVAAVPNWKELIISSFKFPDGTTGNDYPDLLAKITDILSQLNQGENGEWYYYTRMVDEVDEDGELTGNIVATQAYDLTVFFSASKDIKTLFMNSAVLRVPTMIAEHYEPIDYKTLHRSTYPYSIV